MKSWCCHRIIHLLIWFPTFFSLGSERLQVESMVLQSNLVNILKIILQKEISIITQLWVSNLIRTFFKSHFWKWISWNKIQTWNIYMAVLYLHLWLTNISHTAKACTWKYSLSIYLTFFMCLTMFKKVFIYF